MADRVCPWWMGYFLASSVRKWLQDPARILEPYVKPGMVTLDVGCAMGFFTLPMARLVTESGHVVAVDLQEKMLNSLRRRAGRAGLIDRIEFRQCLSSSLGVDDLAGKIDFALAFAVIHEMPDPSAAFASIAQSLRTGGKLLLAEPSDHVKGNAFSKTLAAAEKAGLKKIDAPTIRLSRSAVFARE